MRNESISGNRKSFTRAFTAFLMIANATVFFFGAVQHAGISIGPFHEPVIPGAAVVESLCGAALIWGATVFVRRSTIGAALAANLGALAGVLFGIAALAAGFGPRTASNDLYHRLMLGLIGGSLLGLLLRQLTASRHRSRQ